MRKPFADSLESSLEDGNDQQRPISYEGIGVERTQAIAETQLGARRTITSLTAKEWIFLALTGVGILASCGFAIYFLATNAEEMNADFTLALLILLNGFFTAYYMIDGVFTERAYELLVLAGTVLIVTIYLTANFIYTMGWSSSVKIARLCVAGLLGPASVGLGLSIVFEYLSSGNFIFRKVGADANLQRICRRLFITESVIKFDLQSTASVVLLAAKNGTVSLAEKLVLSLGLSTSLIWSGLAIVALRLENYSLTIALLVVGLVQPAYMTFVTVMNVDRLVNSTTPLIPENADFSDSLPTVSLVTAVSALILRFLLFVLMVLTMKNFGQGLRRKLVPPILRRLTRSEYENV